MQVTINDKLHNLVENSSIAMATEAIGLNTNNIAIAVNFSVVPKECWDKFILKENDKIMIIRATQGG